MRANFRRIGPHISVSYASNFALLAYFNSDARKPAKIAEVKNPCEQTSGKKAVLVKIKIVRV